MTDVPAWLLLVLFSCIWVALLYSFKLLSTRLYYEEKLVELMQAMDDMEEYNKEKIRNLISIAEMYEKKLKEKK